VDGYTKAAIRKALAKRTPRQVNFDNFMDRLINGPMVYVFAVCCVLGTIGMGHLGEH